MATPAPLATIPYADIRGHTPVKLAETYAGRATGLAHASTEMFGPAKHLVRSLGLPLGDRISRAWLERFANPYLDEIRAIAETLHIDGVYFLNVCFEWGCTSGAFAARDGIALHRVLDWPFPALGESVVVAHQSGDAGEFYNVTWPGLSGMYQGMAHGRFAAAINQAPMRKHGRGFAGDWFTNRLAVRGTNALPAAHLLRQTFEQAASYARAREMLCATPIATPAIFILTGVSPDEGCVIERTESLCGMRELNGTRVCATNQFDSGLEGRWLARPIDSPGRLRAAWGLAPDDVNQGFSWFVPPIANVNSRLVVNANAGTGALQVLGTAGVRPATAVFDLAATT
ncbi:MAG: hypothetical protein ABSD74_03815 [Rhizomicrobium sp.]|jgi:hypothetical protein